MSEKDNGGPAFPGTYTARCDQGRGSVVEFHDKGLSLRDYFAAKAMAAIIMNPETQRELSNMDRDTGMIVISKVAYMQADAMLAERAK